ncbi:hypothetical protein DICVIV_05068 [Dictyocaulus viviparus]|uniref:Globin n=1 Tax=Dictyocaulus viviparus TaxID=29172 RepID=A0A0D8XWE4_DICVI|nr:hypothetical protein DICVIV_05068 [Dictyocaulus viviparus]
MGNTKSVDQKDEKEESIKPKHKLSTGATRRMSVTTKKMSRSSTSSQGNRRPFLTTNQRSIIKFCMDNSKDDFADRIIRRATEKKDDFKSFIDNLPKTQRIEVSEGLRAFLVGVCDILTDSEEIQRVAEDFGASHVPFRSYGFKPDFFAGTADAVTTECTYLDQATHTPSETAGAWSTLSAFLFSAVRDGYYAELRRQRKASSAYRSRPSFDVSSDGSYAECGSRKSISPAPDEISQNSEPKENAPSYLLPPQVY